MLPSEQFAVGTVVRYIGTEMPDRVGCRGIVVRAPRASRRPMSTKERWRWTGMRVQFSTDSTFVFAWIDQYEVVSAVELLADLASGERPARVLRVTRLENPMNVAKWLSARVKSISASGVPVGHLGTVEEVGQGAKLGFVWVRWDGSPSRFRGKAVRVNTDSLELLA